MAVADLSHRRRQASPAVVRVEAHLGPGDTGRFPFG